MSKELSRREFGRQVGILSAAAAASYSADAWAKPKKDTLAVDPAPAFDLSPGL